MLLNFNKLNVFPNNLWDENAIGVVLVRRSGVFIGNFERISLFLLVFLLLNLNK